MNYFNNLIYIQFKILIYFIFILFLFIIFCLYFENKIKYDESNSEKEEKKKINLYIDRLLM